MCCMDAVTRTRNPSTKRTTSRPDRDFALLHIDRKPTSQQITQRMLAIAAAEGLSLNNAAMTALVASANGDLRLVLGQLQMLRLRAVSLTYDEVKGRDAANKVPHTLYFSDTKLSQ